MTYEAIDPRSSVTGEVTRAPTILGVQGALWSSLFGTKIDDTTSDPRMLDVLSALVSFTAPQVIVEAGTYRGWGLMTLAETLRVYDLPGHVWSADPVDYGVQELVDQAGLTDRVTLIHAPFEQLLAELPAPPDFAYIDCSDLHEPSLRLRYATMALERMASGGLICVDDAAGDWPGAKALRRLGLYLPNVRGLVVIAT